MLYKYFVSDMWKPFANIGSVLFSVLRVLK